MEMRFNWWARNIIFVEVIKLFSENAEKDTKEESDRFIFKILILFSCRLSKS
jgi:hypothetical protein